MNRNILAQYSNMRKEIKDLKDRIKKLDKFLANPPIVLDTVKGTRRDGTIGPIRITGIPEPMYKRKQRLRKQHQQLLEGKEVELLELTCQAERYIQSIPKSELRIMFRLHFIDGNSYAKVAKCMNSMFPNRGISYNEESVKKRILRFFEKVEKCPPMS